MELLPPSLRVVDLLSSLPEHLLDEILRRLDLRDAVRTSALSRVWRRRWESIPGLALCFPNGARASAIDHVLRRYTGPSISRFVSYVHEHDVDDWDWFVELSCRSVKSITIFNNTKDTFTLGSTAIFSCDRLVSLSLERCSIPPIPGFAGFPVLQTLYLRDVEFADDGERELEAIIRGSPLLHVLALEEVFTPVDCVIEAPNLHTLQFKLIALDGGDCWRFGELPRLQYASMDVFRCEHHFLEILAGVSQVQELHLFPPEDVEIDTIPFTFHNLKSLDLITDFADWDHILLVFSLLRSSPNLEKLQIAAMLNVVFSYLLLCSSKSSCCCQLISSLLLLAKTIIWNIDNLVQNRDILDEEWDAQWTDGMCSNLQVVQIKSYMTWLPLSFMKLILSKAELLRTLSVDLCPLSQDDPLNELLKCRRASAQAQVQFKVKKLYGWLQTTVS